MNNTSLRHMVDHCCNIGLSLSTIIQQIIVLYYNATIKIFLFIMSEKLFVAKANKYSG